MKKFLIKYKFTSIFLLINILSLIILRYFPEDHWFGFVIFTPFVLWNYLVDIMCPPIPSQEIMCEGLPSWAGASMMMLTILIVIGSFGFITCIGLLIDIIRNKK